eukprot:TRINITY_DN2117_c0_g1_i3.p1 TRINITY_DN2117_c0_g1~~TRINITY_DN2117_c0_g1_i3.p1  ORF type:complete len:614 (+),score=160.15 TRINITY_DN2117_c0_g1_i3:32-1873(+)
MGGEDGTKKPRLASVSPLHLKLLKNVILAIGVLFLLLLYVHLPVNTPPTKTITSPSVFEKEQLQLLREILKQLGTMEDSQEELVLEGYREREQKETERADALLKELKKSNEKLETYLESSKAWMKAQIERTPAPTPAPTPVSFAFLPGPSTRASPTEAPCDNGGELVKGKCVCPVGYVGDFCKIGAEQRGGPWSPETHTKQIWFDSHVVPSILKSFASLPQSVMDVGCGLGLYLKDLHFHGVTRCVGVEPANMAKSTISPFHSGDCVLLQLNAFDPTPGKPPVSLGEQFDLVISVEVAEHIPLAAHEKYFNFLTQHAKDVIVFSGGTPGQGGTGHISLRNFEDWLAEFEKRGWHCDVEATERMRSSVDFFWFKRNIAMFRKSYTYSPASLLKLVNISIPYPYNFPGVMNLTFPTFSSPVFSSSPMFAPMKSLLSSVQVRRMKKRYTKEKEMAKKSLEVSDRWTKMLEELKKERELEAQENRALPAGQSLMSQDERENMNAHGFPKTLLNNKPEVENGIPNMKVIQDEEDEEEDEEDLEDEEVVATTAVPKIKESTLETKKRDDAKQHQPVSIKEEGSKSKMNELKKDEAKVATAAPTKEQRSQIYRKPERRWE